MILAEICIKIEIRNVSFLYFKYFFHTNNMKQTIYFWTLQFYRYSRLFHIKTDNSIFIQFQLRQ